MVTATRTIEAVVSTGTGRQADADLEVRVGNNGKLITDMSNSDVCASAAVVASIGGVIRVDLAAGALAETDVVMEDKVRVIDARVVLRGAGVANTTLKVQNGATTITDAMDVSGSDKAMIRAATLDDAQWDISAGGTLRIKTETGATQPACTVFVEVVRVD